VKPTLLTSGVASCPSLEDFTTIQQPKPNLLKESKEQKAQIQTA